MKIRLNGGAEADYAGSLEAERSETGWMGEWTIQGEAGRLSLREDSVALEAGGGAQTQEKLPAEDGREELLADVAEAVRSGGTAQTDLLDNCKSLALSLAAIRSLEQGAPVSLLDGLFSIT